MTNEEAKEKIFYQWQDFLEHNLDYAGISEAYRMAIKALETITKYKDAYNKGWNDGAKATYEHLKMCEEEQEPLSDVLREIRQEIEERINNCGDGSFKDGLCEALDIVYFKIKEFSE